MPKKKRKRTDRFITLRIVNSNAGIKARDIAERYCLTATPDIAYTFTQNGKFRPGVNVDCRGGTIFVSIKKEVGHGIPA